jgi:hypothetical protein
LLAEYMKEIASFRFRLAPDLFEIRRCLNPQKKTALQGDGPRYV